MTPFVRRIAELQHLYGVVTLELTNVAFSMIGALGCTNDFENNVVINTEMLFIIILHLEEM